MLKTKNGWALTTKNSVHNKLLEEAISQNEILKYKVTTFQLQKQRPKLLLYNVNKEIAQEELQDAVSNQNDISNNDNKILFKLEIRSET